MSKQTGYADCPPQRTEHLMVSEWGPATPSAGPRTREVLLAQVRSVPRDLTANTRRMLQLLEEHPSVDIAVFPELFLSGYELEHVEELAITRVAPEMQVIAKACAQRTTAAVFGFIESDGIQVFDSIAAFDSNGELAGVYRKVNLFGREAEVFHPGNCYENVELTGLRVGLLNCFDIEFPEPARTLAINGAQILISIAANMDPYFNDHELASRARALDNRLPHIYVNAIWTAAGFTCVGGSR